MGFISTQLVIEACSAAATCTSGVDAPGISFVSTLFAKLYIEKTMPVCPPLRTAHKSEPWKGWCRSVCSAVARGSSAPLTPSPARCRSVRALASGAGKKAGETACNHPVDRYKAILLKLARQNLEYSKPGEVENCVVAEREAESACEHDDALGLYRARDDPQRPVEPTRRELQPNPSYVERIAEEAGHALRTRPPRGGAISMWAFGRSSGCTLLLLLLR
eukprot:CAMPEP_0180022520 /NCGR_PEP_ID=MMETSP0984-20121128/22917_1 /TAXON_ID=483367 /ORGANISM="non described non described, Strain CCMP 2436" /LENGTH=218 /DNA_ID=CAMNT_0021946593 /DNA_START=167 /DNA_END=818 /DNA_ORIENTATION=-